MKLILATLTSLLFGLSAGATIPLLTSAMVEACNPDSTTSQDPTAPERTILNHIEGHIHVSVLSKVSPAQTVDRLLLKIDNVHGKGECFEVTPQVVGDHGPAVARIELEKISTLYDSLFGQLIVVPVAFSAASTEVPVSQMLQIRVNRKNVPSEVTIESQKP